jgi:UDP-glucose 4-epimerase
MKVLITGVAGFMGSHLADSFLAKGYEVHGIDNLLGGYEDNIPSGVVWHNLDLGDFDAVKDIFIGVDLSCSYRMYCLRRSFSISLQL